MDKEKKQLWKVIRRLAFCVFTKAPHQYFNQLTHIIHKLHAVFLKDVLIVFLKDAVFLKDV